VPAGVGELFHSCGWNNEKRLEELFAEYGDKTAALMVACDYVNAEAGHTFYPFMRKLADKYGALLIYDEIVMGMRIAVGGAHEYFGVNPDLAVFSKGIANGMPLSVYLGRADVMEACGRKGKAVVSSTFAGEALSLAASKVCFETYAKEDVIGHIWRMSARLWDGLNGIFEAKGLGIRAKGLPPLCPLVFEDNKLVEPFCRAAYRNGVCLYVGGSSVNYSTQAADIDEALERLNKACGEIK